MHAELAQSQLEQPRPPVEPLYDLPHFVKPLLPLPLATCSRAAPTGERSHGKDRVVGFSHALTRPELSKDTFPGRSGGALGR